ncbi:DUF805 domain-containing protein [Psychrobacter arenosus]|uniref:DUF805 domain-containing protein n=1 Tax=Psychrobacter arenosus TaxID=256326 RepID=UPI001D111172|nr:DUF805 domain-containing protein [Psychrobacter arenosus]
MKGKVLNYSEQNGQGTVVAEDNNTYIFSTYNWLEQAQPMVGDEVKLDIDHTGSVVGVSYGLLRKNYAATVPQDNPMPVIDHGAMGANNMPAEWAIEENYTIVDWFKKCLRKYATFQGRARRKEYWYCNLMVIIIYIVAAIIDGILGTDGVIASLAILALFIPLLSVMVRRLHDINKSGWWYWISIIPLIGGILLLVWMCTDTNPNTNQYGPPARNVNL